jgi:hypothetical protein
MVNGKSASMVNARLMVAAPLREKSGKTRRKLNAR